MSQEKMSRKVKTFLAAANKGDHNAQPGTAYDLAQCYDYGLEVAQAILKHNLV